MNLSASPRRRLAAHISLLPLKQITYLTHLIRCHFTIYITQLTPRATHPPGNGLAQRMPLASAFSTIPPSFLPSLRLRPRPGLALNSRRLRPWLLVHLATHICTPTQLLLFAAGREKQRWHRIGESISKLRPRHCKRDPIQCGKYHRKTQGKTHQRTGTLARSKYHLTAETVVPEIEGLRPARWN